MNGQETEVIKAEFKGLRELVDERTKSLNTRVEQMNTLWLKQLAEIAKKPCDVHTAEILSSKWHYRKLWSVLIILMLVAVIKETFFK